MKLTGIKIRNFRSFDPSGITLDKLGKVNVFIGKNNSGKSNIIRFISNLYHFIDKSGTIYPLLESDFFNSDKKKYPISMSLQFLTAQLSQFHLHGKIESYLNQFEDIWVEFEIGKADGDFRFYGGDHESGWLRKIFSDEEKVKTLCLAINQSSADHGTNMGVISGSIEAIRNPFRTNNFFLIDSFRKIEEPAGDYDQNSFEGKLKRNNGFDLVKRLGELKNPSHLNYKESKKKFEKIENFLRDILNQRNLTLEISRAPEKLSVQVNNEVVPLENVGTGIHQLIILAAAITINDNCIFCIEEPENYLHPEIQRKFFRYLINETTNQYFITTHSNSFINLDDIDIFHVKHDGTKTSVTKSMSSSDKYQLLDDLGYHASDLLQTNFIIWVEGPSDRIYLNHWINEKDEELVEGIHYSIMFYGGRLLSHLAVNDDVIVKDFIRLNSLNRNCAILIDSDKKSEEDSINDSKQRIVKEFSSLGYLAWITEGKEIENYISEENLKASLSGLLKEKNYTVSYGKFKKHTQIAIEGDSDNKDVDKIGLSKEVSKMKTDWSTFDLETRVDALIVAIRKANAKP